MRRAANCDGICPETTLDGLSEMLEGVSALRGSLEDYEVVVRGSAADDPVPWQERGATWWLTQFSEDAGFDEVLSVVEAGPARGPSG
jgi:hypothetical protein